MMIKRGSNCCETLCNTNSLEVSWFSCGLALVGGGSITGVQKLFVDVYWSVVVSFHTYRPMPTCSSPCGEAGDRTANLLIGR